MEVVDFGGQVRLPKGPKSLANLQVSEHKLYVLNFIQASKVHQWRNVNTLREIEQYETCKMNSLNKLIILCSLYSENRGRKRKQKNNQLTIQYKLYTWSEPVTNSLTCTI